MQTSVGTGHTTHPSLHLRDANDAHIVFEAVRLGVLPLIKRRLTSEERDQLSSGNVFVWEEAEHKGGLERWTDGRRWSQSRMKGEYLFYEEKVETTEEEKQAKAARRASRNAGNPIQNAPTRRQDRPAKPDGLTKQTYSTQVQVYVSGVQSLRKWHIVAYFSGNDYTRLPVVENFEYLRRIRIPEGVFFSAKGLIKRADGSYADGDVDDDYSGSSSVYGDDFGGSSPIQHFVPKDNYPSDPRHDMRSGGGRYGVSPAPLVSRVAPSRTTSHESGALPRLSTIAPLPPPGHFSMHSPSSRSPQGHHSGGHAAHSPSAAQASSPRNYRPLSPEDRRALNTFKIVL